MLNEEPLTGLWSEVTGPGCPSPGSSERPDCAATFSRDSSCASSCSAWWYPGLGVACRPASGLGSPFLC